MAAPDLREGADITGAHMTDETDLGRSEIKEYFSGSSILITGGTGFLGKLLIEKLLRSCPEIKRLYLLCRPKKGKEIMKRLEEQFSDPLFESLRKAEPNFISKITAISGDCGQKDLGMSEEDTNTLINEVDIIFHGAATVRFDEKLRIAVAINVRGTRDMLLLARRMPRLRAFVHVSTAYSNCVRKTIEEKFYDPPVTGDKLIDLVETIDESTLERITPGLLGDFPNTYAYTKAVAEDIVKNYSKGLPVAMIRPSIIIATYKEPCAGWIDNVYGPTGVVIGAALGLLRTLHCNPKIIADLVPGDYVINASIAAAWDIGRSRSDNPNKELPALSVPLDDPTPSNVVFEEPIIEDKELDTVPIYNYVSSEQKPLTWESFMYWVELYGREVPSPHIIWIYFFTLNKYKWLDRIYSLFLHWIPAYIIDTVLYCIGKKPMFINAYTKLSKVTKSFEHLTTNRRKLSTKHTRRLFRKLTYADSKYFNFDIEELDWLEYLRTYIYGIRVYILKDAIDTVPEGVKRRSRFFVAHYLLILILGLACYKFVF